ncbi:hypothetical protein CBM2592_B100343 [Cupriavidus taiwanensis]|nr:hypothetical protein CBM2592_B100343 [Cupriavidus taiwanensis]SOY63036.1 hypothetical protein CBM2588_B130006 [Cupriavidus taiwanensis]SOY98130.1 hypothetical protein CBM2591_B80345 [Cupriavidus taiwanensis]SOZ77159.1 hypothetical protein CBM2617_U10004 [Cupriavidus taiwanensis]SOZ85165.1 hypothetical protein CBM2618_B130021 [Cupriavidus taiwanensis]
MFAAELPHVPRVSSRSSYFRGMRPGLTRQQNIPLDFREKMKQSQSKLAEMFRVSANAALAGILSGDNILLVVSDDLGFGARSAVTDLAPCCFQARATDS